MSKIICNFAAAFDKARGALAHLVERNVRNVKVVGSSPICSTGRLSQHVRAVLHDMHDLFQNLLNLIQAEAASVEEAA